MKRLSGQLSHAPGLAHTGGWGVQRSQKESLPSHLTDGAVLAVPAWAALTLAISACPMLGTARMAGPLVAGCPHPAIFTAAGTPNTDAMAPTVSSTDLCRGGGEKIQQG